MSIQQFCRQGISLDYICMCRWKAKEWLCAVSYPKQKVVYIQGGALPCNHTQFC